MLYNVYCDETCHLEHDDSNAMVLGAIWCPKEKVKEINHRIREIKVRHRLSKTMELKWTKVSPAKIDLYKDLVNYFFDDTNLHFRGVLIPNKRLLEHERFSQTHDTWYYKMYFEMLKIVLSPTETYEVYIDIKDTHSAQRVKKLEEVCRNHTYDFSQKIIRRIQPIRSDEVQVMQLVDILAGAIGYENRNFPETFERSLAKRALVDLIKQRSRYTLQKTTLLREGKLNLLAWQPGGMM